MPSPPDGGRQAQPCPRGSLAKARGTLPCETDRAKPDRMSHDWHVQPSCQRSLRKLGLSRFPFGSRLRPEGLICPRTWCASPASNPHWQRPFRNSLQPPAFLRELFESIELSTSCQAGQGYQHGTRSQPLSRSAKLSNIQPAKCPNPLRADSRELVPGHAMACSL
jgi:hypothetical protein